MSISRTRMEAFLEAFRNRHVRSPGVALAEGVWDLPDHELLVLPRDTGDIRYPYGSQGYNLWAYASGYVHGNDGLFNILPRTSEGQDPRLSYHARYETGTGKSRTVSLLGVPWKACEGVERFAVFCADGVVHGTVRATDSFVLAISATVEGGFRSTLAYFPHGEQPETLRQILVCLNPGLNHELYESGESRWFRKAEYHSTPAPEFHFACNEDVSRILSVTHSGLARQRIEPAAMALAWEATCSRSEWCGGSHRSLGTALCLETGTLPEQRRVCTFNDWALAGTIIHLDETAPFTHSLDFASAMASSCRDQEAPVAAWHDPADFRIACVSNQEDFLSGDRFGAFVFHLRRQIDFCSTIKGYVQLSPNSLIGIRDVFQALEAASWWDQGTCRAKMLEALGTIAEDGRCPRQYSLPGPDGTRRMDLRPFVDQGNWVISTVVQHLRIHGDYEFLEETCGFLNLEDEAKRIVSQSVISSSVLDHLVRIMAWVEAQRDHAGTGCLRALYGDWNDALDGLGVSLDASQTYGSGVSVMASLHYYQNLGEMAELCQALDARGKVTGYDLKKLGAAYLGQRRALREGLLAHAVVRRGTETRILHGWGDGKSYTVGGFNDVDGVVRDALVSTAFWVLCGMNEASPDMHDSLLAAFERLGSIHGLKTFEPGFLPDCPGVGRIPKLPVGTAENGAVYVHASLFGVWALFRMGEAERAWNELRTLLPYLKPRLNVSPFVMPNSYGHNPDLLINGESMQDWQTGSSNVLMKILIGEVFGIRPDLNGCLFAPALWNPFRSMELDLRLRGAVWRVRWHSHLGAVPGEIRIDGSLVGAGTRWYLDADRLEQGGTLEFGKADPS